MEVLQTSALPLGDGAGWNLCTKKIRPRLGAATTAMVRLKPDTTTMVRLKPDTTTMVRLKPDATNVRLTADTTNRGTGGEGHRSFSGAGNGIRTRDFDLGKVALYH